MSDEFRMMPTLKPVNLNSDFIHKGMKDLLGVNAANQLKEETDISVCRETCRRNLPMSFF